MNTIPTMMSARNRSEESTIPKPHQPLFHDSRITAPHLRDQL